MEFGWYATHRTDRGNILAYSRGKWQDKKGHDLQQRQGTMLQGQASSWFFRSSTGIQGKFSGKEKSEGNNSTKIDNPIFGVLQTFPP